MAERLVIPTDPAEFFEDFFPRQFTEGRDRYPPGDSPGWALFEVLGGGAWGIRATGDRLTVCRGKPEDTLLQIGISEADFRAIFVDRTQREIDETGRLSDDSRDVFRPLFASQRTIDSLGTATATLVVHLYHEGGRHRLFLTPGGMERTAPRSTVSLQLHDFLAMTSGRRSFARLLLLGRIRVRGDVLYARRLSALLG